LLRKLEGAGTAFDAESFVHGFRASGVFELSLDVAARVRALVGEDSPGVLPWRLHPFFNAL
jgi:hypothetical protein